MDHASVSWKNSCWDLARVGFYFLRMGVVLALCILFGLACVLLLFELRSPAAKASYGILGAYFFWLSVRMVRLTSHICRTHPPSAASDSEPFELLPLSQLGVYADCANAMQPQLCWLEEAALVRSPVLLLEQTKRPERSIRLKIGIPILAALSDEEASCLMSYKVARCLRAASPIDRLLESLNRAAKTRIKSPNKKPGEPIRGAAFWAPLCRYSLRAVARNEQFARNCTAVTCGAQLMERTFDRIERIQNAWPIFEKSALLPLLHMGGMPPVAESFRIWLASGGNIAAAFRAEKPSSHANFSPPGQRFASLRDHERLLYKKVMGGRELRIIQREDAYARLGPIFWEEQSRIVREGIHGKGLRNLPELLADLSWLCDLTPPSSDRDLPESKNRHAVDQLYFACLTALSKTGWTWQAPPVQPVILVKNAIQICPQLWFQNLLDGSLSGPNFERLLEDQSLLEVPLTRLPESKLLVM